MPAPPRIGRGVVFPASVRALAARGLREDRMPKPDGSQQRARAEQRAAFLYLRVEQSTTWSPALTRQFQRVFGPRWSTTENGRGFAELMVTLELNPLNAQDRAELERVLDGAGVPR